MAQFFNFKGDYLGLTDEQISESRELYGQNVYTVTEKREEEFSPVSVIISPPVIMMFLAGVLSFFGMGIGTGIAVLLIDALYAAAEIYVGRESDKRLREIKQSTDIRFRVIRNGKMTLVKKEEILTDDILVVQKGERVPADAFIRESKELTVDEFALSGSHEIVAKNSGSAKKSALNESFVYSGTTIHSGIAICEVTAVGVDTKLYQKNGEQPESHPYYTKLETTVRSILPLCSGICCLVALVTLVLWLLTGGKLVFAALRAVTLGMCFFPCGLSTVIRLHYTKCASELLHNMALVKSPNDIEKLNSMTTLCVEKSGVIAKETMEVKGVYTDNEELLYNIAVLSCDRNTTDPAEQALLLKATFFDENIYEACEKNTVIERLPDGDETLDGALWDFGEAKLYCIKGTPERVFPLCRMRSEELFAAKKRLNEFYSQGCRVIALACADAEEGSTDSTAGFRYTFIGFVAFSAPLRDSVAAAIATCRRVGVRVVMFSDDNPSVAAATGRMIGLSGVEPATAAEVAAAMRGRGTLNLRSEVYAQLSEQQKLYVIDALKANGEVVAMTATRADDANLLEQADIGITMSQYTSGSAYESSDIIMNDDNFVSIANTIASARQTHRNIKRSVSAMLSGYLALLVMNLANIFAGEQLMLSPAVLALATMVLIPAAALMYFGSHSDMKEIMPPSDYVTSRRINLPFIAEAVLFGILSGAVAVASYMFMYSGSNSEFARACALVAMAFCTAAFGIIRIHRRNPLVDVAEGRFAGLISLAVMIVLPIALVYIPAVNTAFGLMAIDLLAMFISIATGIIPAIIYYVVRIMLKNK